MYIPEKFRYRERKEGDAPLFDQVHQRIQGHYSSQTVVDHYVLHCIVGGKGIYQIHGRNYHLEAGDCFLLIPNVPILYQSDVLDPWVYYWIGFEGMDARHLMKLSGIDKDSPTLRFEPVEELASILGPLISSTPRPSQTRTQPWGDFTSCVLN